MQANCPSPTARYSGFINLQIGISEPSVGRGGACSSSLPAIVAKKIPLICHPHGAFLLSTPFRAQAFAIRSRRSAMIFFSSLEMYDCEMPR